MLRPTAFLMVFFLSSQAASQGSAIVGSCYDSEVRNVRFRLESSLDGTLDRNSGSAIEFRDGLYLVGFDRVPAVHRSKIGDRVQICLVAEERNCARGLEPTRTYRVANTRTRDRFTMSDSTKSCQ